MGFNSNDALITRFFYGLLKSSRILVKAYFHFLFSSDLDFLVSIFQTQTCFETYTEWLFCATIFLDSGDSRNKFSMIPPLRNSQCSRQTGHENNMKILWENAEQIAMGIQDRKNPWGSDESSQKMWYWVILPWDKESRRAFQAEKSMSKSMGNEGMSIVFKNRS